MAHLFWDYRHLIFTLGDAPQLFIADLPAQQFIDAVSAHLDAPVDSSLRRWILFPI